MEKILDFYYDVVAYWKTYRQYIIGAVIAILLLEIWRWFWGLF